jgi:hypothetical protein
MKPRIGQTLISPVDTTTVIVIRSPDDELDITCGGVEMLPKDAAVDTSGARSLDPELMAGAKLGKRYAAEELGLELLCTRAGEGTLAVNGAPISRKDAKPLPASD